jgi:hypothetical protein
MPGGAISYRQLLTEAGKEITMSEARMRQLSRRGLIESGGGLAVGEAMATVAGVPLVGARASFAEVEKPSAPIGPARDGVWAGVGTGRFAKGDESVQG